MTDLTKITITAPFGLLDEATKKALQKHFDAGGHVEYFDGISWKRARMFSPPSLTYRAAPPVTADEMAEMIRQMVPSTSQSKFLEARALLARYDAQEAANDSPRALAGRRRGADVPHRVLGRRPVLPAADGGAAVSEMHTNEPWTVELIEGMTPGICSPQGEAVVWCSCMDDEGLQSPHDARRIVAAVNACAGIPTEALEAGVVAELVEAARLAIETMEDLGACSDPECREPNCLGTLVKMRTALAKLEEQL